MFLGSITNEKGIQIDEFLFNMDGNNDDGLIIFMNHELANVV